MLLLRRCNLAQNPTSCSAAPNCNKRASDRNRRWERGVFSSLNYKNKARKNFEVTCTPRWVRIQFWQKWIEFLSTELVGWQVWLHNLNTPPALPPLHNPSVAAHSGQFHVANSLEARFLSLLALFFAATKTALWHFTTFRSVVLENVGRKINWAAVLELSRTMSKVTLNRPMTIAPSCNRFHWMRKRLTQDRLPAGFQLVCQA